MTWLLFTGLAIFSRAFFGIISKVFSTNVRGSVATQSFLLTIASAIIALVISPFLGADAYSILEVNLVSAIIVIISLGLGNIFYFLAMKTLTSGTAQIAFSSILIFNTIISLIFFNLQLSSLNMIGIVILLIAILTVITGRIEYNLKGVGWMILSAFFFSVFQLSSADLSQQVGVASYLLISYLGSSLLILVAQWTHIVSDLRAQNSLKELLKLPSLIAFASVGYFAFAYFAYRAAPEPARVAIMLPAQVVVTVFLGYIFLHEKKHVFRKLAAAVLVVIAVLLIKS